MSLKKINKELDTIMKNYQDFSIKKDEQSLFYIDQMVDLLFNELKYESEDLSKLNKLTKDFKALMLKVLDNLKEYFGKMLNTSVTNINQIIDISTSNRYIDVDNMKKIYKKFEEEINDLLKIKDKINLIIDTNSSAFLENIINISPDHNKHKISEIVLRYKSFISDELIKNVKEKSDHLKKNYKVLIDSFLNEMQTDRDKIKSINQKIINDIAFSHLKEEEYFIINKYIKESFDYTNNTFKNFEDYLLRELSVKKNSKKENTAKDYLLSFSNTINVKLKQLFDEMNKVIYLDNKDVNNKLKEFNDLISRVYEKPFVFDKEFLKYKKTFNVPNRNIDKFDDSFNQFKDEVTKHLKTNISNIFRDSLKIYNDMIYKTMALKFKLSEFNTVLSVDKVKDLLLK